MRTVDRNKIIVDSLYLFNQSDSHRLYTVADLQTYLLTPVKYNTIRVYYAGEEPVGLITWCWLTPNDSRLFLENKYHPSEDDHDKDSRDGKELWGMELIAPHGHTRQVLRAIHKEYVQTYGESEVHWRRFHDRTRKHKRKFK